MKFLYLIIFLFSASISNSFADDIYLDTINIENILITEDTFYLDSLIINDNISNISNESVFKITETKDNNRFLALAFTILTGPIGGHRIYMGTGPLVPVVYAITLGGGFGILPLIDFIVISTTNDISKYQNNRRIFMWIK
jgi:hypothetical protein